MLLNYLKITWAVMKRRKFYTFISLFGIATTLTVLIVLAAFLDHLFAPNYPEVWRNRTLYIQQLKEKSDKGWSRSGPMSLRFIRDHVYTLKTPAKIGISSTPNTTNAYLGAQKFKFYIKYTDAGFWEVTQFDFLEGRPYTQQNIDNNDFVAVINDRTRDNYFGKGAAAVGKFIEIESIRYRVIGVVRGCPITRLNTASDIYMPYNCSKTAQKVTEGTGEFAAILLANDVADLPKIKAEYAETIARAQEAIPKGSEYKYLISKATGFLEGFVSDIFDGAQDNGKPFFFTVIALFALFFMTLPALNLVNLNISRILERASEIGIRKAFGASAKRLIGQFIVENVLITLVGGLLALLLSGAIIYLINSRQLFEYIDLRINWTVVFAAFSVSLAFGLLSGVYPAWRMSKLPAAEALRGSEV